MLNEFFYNECGMNVEWYTAINLFIFYNECGMNVE